ncbi:MAG: hypothetical protein IKK73_01775 [Akkermansia sp.]|nr:hypothetical protein [Akkermansia sp.]
MKITTTIHTVKDTEPTPRKSAFDRLLEAHDCRKLPRWLRYRQVITPASCEAWLRKVAGCDQVVRDWILRDTPQRFVYLNPLGEVWGKVQHYMVQHNFRVPEGYTHLLQRDSLQQTVAMAPAQMLGLRLLGETVTSAVSLKVLPLNECPFRNIWIYPEDIAFSAVQAMALLAGGFTCPVRMLHAIPDGLTPRQQRIIRSLFYQLSEIFTSSGFDVSMEAAPVSQFAEELAH